MGTENKLKTSADSETISPEQTKDISQSQLSDCNSDSHKYLHRNQNSKPHKNWPEFSSSINRTSNVPHIPIHIDEHNVVEGAKSILRVIRHDWDLRDVQFKTFTDGITNKLVGCFYPLNNSNANNTIQSESLCVCSNDDSGNLSDAPEDESVNTSVESVVLVRVYGNKTDLLIDRKAETRNFILLHSYGFAPSLYATFINGLAYDYVPGVTLNSINMQLPSVWQLVARRMAEMHRVVKGTILETEEEPTPMLLKKTLSFFDLVPERFTNLDKHNRLKETFLPISKMRNEFKILYEHLNSLGSPLVFSHNDLLLGNVIYTESQKAVSFIDFEYADYNFQAYDIGNHFAEFAGVDNVDYSYYPKKEFQFEWLRVYLQSYLQRIDISHSEIELLYVQVNQFALASHFFWTIWSLIQAEHSNIDFDYVEYAFLRYNEYLAKKDVFMSLTLKRNTDQ